MARRKLTPLEEAIAGEPSDRRKRWEKRAREAGLVRISILVPADQANEFRTLARDRRETLLGTPDGSASND